MQIVFFPSSVQVSSDNNDCKSDSRALPAQKRWNWFPSRALARYTASLVKCEIHFLAVWNTIPASHHYVQTRAGGWGWGEEELGWGYTGALASVSSTGAGEVEDEGKEKEKYRGRETKEERLSFTDQC